MANGPLHPAAGGASLTETVAGVFLLGLVSSIAGNVLYDAYRAAVLPARPALGGANAEPAPVPWGLLAVGAAAAATGGLAVYALTRPSLPPPRSVARPVR